MPVECNCNTYEHIKKVSWLTDVALPLKRFPDTGLYSHSHIAMHQQKFNGLVSSKLEAILGDKLIAEKRHKQILPLRVNMHSYIVASGQCLFPLGTLSMEMKCTFIGILNHWYNYSISYVVATYLMGVGL